MSSRQLIQNNGKISQCQPPCQKYMTDVLSRRTTQQAKENQTIEKYKLKKIIQKYRIKNIVQTFKLKIQRNNQHRTPVQFKLKSEYQCDEERWIKWKGIQMNYKTLQSTVFVGDIIFSLIVFFLSVFQAFIKDFRLNISNTSPIVFLKIIAVVFQFLKVLIKSIKKQVIKGHLLTYVTDIIINSTGIVDLLIYLSAIFIILLSIILPHHETVGIVSFIIASIKLFTIPKNIKVLEIHYINSNRKQQYWDLIKIIIFQLVFGHFIAGILLAMTTLNPNANWIIHKGLQNTHWGQLYYWTIYWSATLITTTGFGDFSATNSDQAIFVAGIQLFSSMVLVYNINLIGTIVLAMRTSDQTLEKKLAIFRRMNNQNPINRSLEGKIHSFISFQNEIKEQFQFKERQLLLKELPDQLREEYYNDVNQTIFKQLPFFRHLRLQSLISLAKAFQSKVYYPGQYLIRNRHGFNTIFILRNGQVGLLYHRQGSSLNGVVVDQIQIKNNQLQPILLTNTFLNRMRAINYDIQAVDYSLIMGLKEDDLLNIIRKSQLDCQHYFTLYDKHQNTFVFQNQACHYCPGEYHNKFQCPKLHYIPFTSLIVNQYRSKMDIKNQSMPNFKRENAKKEHCYYLRKNFFRPYQQINSIKPRHLIKMLIEQIQKNQIKEKKRDYMDIVLDQCEAIFRRTLKQIKISTQNEQNDFFGIPVDTLYDTLSYFQESNPNKLVATQIKKFKKKLRRINTAATALSSKYIYRPQSQVIEVREETYEGKGSSKDLVSKKSQSLSSANDC